MDTKMSPLSRLVAPISREAFLAEYYEKKPLVVNRESPGYFADLLSIEDVERTVATMHVSHPDVFIANALKQVEATAYTYPDGLIDVARIAQQFADGGTIVVNELRRWVPSLAMFCRALEHETSARFQANMYYSPKNAQGFKVHYDSHDVFVVQIHGSKHWYIYGTPVELPFRGQPYDKSKVPEPGPVSMEFDLHPGDMVYIPRGMMHDAQTRNVDSIHVTVGINHTSWTELLLEVVAKVALNDPEFRRGLPAGYARPDFDRASAQKTLTELLRRVSDRADLAAALDHFTDDLVATRDPILPDQLAQMRRLDEINPDARVGVRPNLVYQIKQTDEHAIVVCYGTDVKMPAHTLEELRYAMATPEFRVGALPGDLDDAGKVVLVRRLVREGFLRIL